MFTLSLITADSEELQSLYEWLSADPDVRRTTTLEPQAVEDETDGAMGAAFDVVNLLVTSGFSAANLVIAYAAWKDARDSGARLVIRKGDQEITIEDASPDDIAAASRWFSDMPSEAN